MAELRVPPPAAKTRPLQTCDKSKAEEASFFSFCFAFAVITIENDGDEKKGIGDKKPVVKAVASIAIMGNSILGYRTRYDTYDC